MTMVRTFTTSTAVLAAGLWLVGSAADVARGEDVQALYAKYCNSCHGPSGKGDGPAGKKLKQPPPDLNASTATNAEAAKMIKEGGKAVGRSPLMPAYASKLSDDQIQALVQYIKNGLAAR